MDTWTPDTLAKALVSLSKSDLSKLPHDLLYSTRSRVPKEQQNKIAPAEHRAFAREVVAEDPLMAISLAAGIPAYQLYKTIQGARSGPSLDQVTQGYAGIGDGLIEAFRNLTFTGE